MSKYPGGGDFPNIHSDTDHITSLESITTNTITIAPSSNNRSNYNNHSGLTHTNIPSQSISNPANATSYNTQRPLNESFFFHPSGLEMKNFSSVTQINGHTPSNIPVNSRTHSSIINPSSTLALASHTNLAKLTTTALHPTINPLTLTTHHVSLFPTATPLQSTRLPKFPSSSSVMGTLDHGNNLSLGPSSLMLLPHTQKGLINLHQFTNNHNNVSDANIHHTHGGISCTMPASAPKNPSVSQHAAVTQFTQQIPHTTVLPHMALQVQLRQQRIQQQLAQPQPQPPQTPLRQPQQHLSQQSQTPPYQPTFHNPTTIHCTPPHLQNAPTPPLSFSPQAGLLQPQQSPPRAAQLSHTILPGNISEETIIPTVPQVVNDPVFNKKFQELSTHYALLRYKLVAPGVSQYHAHELDFLQTVCLECKANLVQHSLIAPPPPPATKPHGSTPAQGDVFSPPMNGHILQHTPQGPRLSQEFKENLTLITRANCKSFAPLFTHFAQCHALQFLQIMGQIGDINISNPTTMMELDDTNNSSNPPDEVNNDSAGIVRQRETHAQQVQLESIVLMNKQALSAILPDILQVDANTSSHNILTTTPTPAAPRPLITQSSLVNNNHNPLNVHPLSFNPSDHHLTPAEINLEASQAHAQTLQLGYNPINHLLLEIIKYFGIFFSTYLDFEKTRQSYRTMCDHYNNTIGTSNSIVITTMDRIYKFKYYGLDFILPKQHDISCNTNNSANTVNIVANTTPPPIEDINQLYHIYDINEVFYIFHLYNLTTTHVPTFKKRRDCINCGTRCAITFPDMISHAIMHATLHRHWVKQYEAHFCVPHSKMGQDDESTVDKEDNVQKIAIITEDSESIEETTSAQTTPHKLTQLESPIITIKEPELLLMMACTQCHYLFDSLDQTRDHMRVTHDITSPYRPSSYQLSSAAQPSDSATVPLLAPHALELMAHSPPQIHSIIEYNSLYLSPLLLHFKSMGYGFEFQHVNEEILQYLALYNGETPTISPNIDHTTILPTPLNPTNYSTAPSSSESHDELFNASSSFISTIQTPTLQDNHPQDQTKSDGETSSENDDEEVDETPFRRTRHSATGRFKKAIRSNLPHHTGQVKMNSPVPHHMLPFSLLHLRGVLIKNDTLIPSTPPQNFNDAMTMMAGDDNDFVQLPPPSSLIKFEYFNNPYVKTVTFDANTIPSSLLQLKLVPKPCSSTLAAEVDPVTGNIITPTTVGGDGLFTPQGAPGGTGGLQGAQVSVEPPRKRGRPPKRKRNNFKRVNAQQNTVPQAQYVTHGNFSNPVGVFVGTPQIDQFSQNINRSVPDNHCLPQFHSVIVDLYPIPHTQQNNIATTPNTAEKLGFYFNNASLATDFQNNSPDAPRPF